MKKKKINQTAISAMRSLLSVVESYRARQEYRYFHDSPSTKKYFTDMAT